MCFLHRPSLLLFFVALLFSRTAQAQIQTVPTLTLAPARLAEEPTPAFTPLLLMLPPEGPAPSGTAAFANQVSTAFANQVTARCDGCPARRIGRAMFQTTMINVFYNLGNLGRGEETAKITPKTWWNNMSQGWEWDLNDFTTNQFGHPYQGNNYYTSGRANGMNFWESSALAAFGSATWEFFGETNDASLNDFINTTLGGIALGEMFHRAAWLVRDTRAPGGSRLTKEILATAIDPLTGFNRFVSGDASRVTDKPPNVVPSKLGSIGTAGVLWHRSESGSLTDATASPYAEIDLFYGDLTAGRSRNPYDAFAVRLTLGGGKAFSEARVRGRLIGQPLREGALQLTVAQGYMYNNNDAYQFGAQSFDLVAGFVRRLSSSVSVWGVGWGGVTVLGAVDSVVPGETAPVASSSDEEEVTDRDYDYGPGSNAGGYLNFTWGDRTFLVTAYELHHLHVIDGIRGNHLLQRFRADLNLPLRGALGIGVSGDLFYRKTFYQDVDIPTSHSRFPQVRVFLSWNAQ
jgi:hypothetical protein